MVKLLNQSLCIAGPIGGIANGIGFAIFSGGGTGYKSVAARIADFKAIGISKAILQRVNKSGGSGTVSGDVIYG
jgi:hypothetical protein